MSREAPPDAFAGQTPPAAEAPDASGEQPPRQPRLSALWLAAPLLATALAMALNAGFGRLGDVPPPAALAAVLGAVVLTVLAGLRRLGVAVPAVVDVLIGAGPWLVASMAFDRALEGVDLLHVSVFGQGILKANVAGAALRELPGGPSLSAGLWFGAALPILATARGERRTSGALVVLTTLPLLALALLFGPLGAAPVQVLVVTAAVVAALFVVAGLRGRGHPAAAAATSLLLCLTFAAMVEAAFCWLVHIPSLGSYVSAGDTPYFQDLAETVAPVRVRRWAPLVVLAPMLLAGVWWAIDKERKLVRGALALGAALLVVGVTQNWTVRRDGRLTPSPWPPWEYAEGFTPALVGVSRDAPNSGRAPILLMPGAIADVTGRTLAPLDDVTAISTYLTMRMGQRVEAEGDALDPSFAIVAMEEPPPPIVPRLDVLIDRRLPVEELHRFVAAVSLAPLCDINLVGPMTEAPPAAPGSYGPYRGVTPAINMMSVRLRRHCPSDSDAVELDPPMREPLPDIMNADRAPARRVVTQLRPVPLTGTIEEIIARTARVARPELPLWVVPQPRAAEPSAPSPATVDGAP